MIARKIKVQIGIFVTIAIVAIGFISIRYIGLASAFGAGYSFKTELPYGGGLFSNAEVDYRGVPVGRVGGMHLTASGIVVDVHISSSGMHIPSDVTANVANRSVIGEEYLNLVPNSDGAPYLHSGSVIPVADTTVPVSANELLQASNTFLESVPITALQTTVSELSDAFQGSAPDLQRLIDSTNTFYTGAQANFDDASTLLDASKTVLATQEATSDSIISFAHNLSLLNASIAADDGGLRTLINVTPGATNQINGFFTDITSTINVLITNLTSNAEVFQANVGGLQTLLVKAPEAIGIGNRVVTKAGANVGLAVTFFDPLPCTSGYGGTVRHTPQTLDTTPLNTAAGCRPANGSSEVNGAHLPAITAASLLAPTGAGNETVATLASLLGGQG